MIEEWHHPLKAALKAYNTEHWSDGLPALLLGFRTSYKEDLQSSSTELVYGTTIRLPGDFFDSSPMDSSPIQLVENLKSHFDCIRPSPASIHSKRSVFVHPALKDCSHVFIRNDTVKNSHKLLTMDLSKYFTGTDKTFDVDIDGRKSTISIDRVIPAFLKRDPVQPAVVTETVRSVKPCIPVTRENKTRNGRTVRFIEKNELIAADIIEENTAEWASPMTAWTKQFFFNTDGSHIAIASILMQKQEDGELQHISYYSRTLTATESRYPANEIENLAIRNSKYGKFTEDCIPDGDDVFVFASTYYDSVSVHIRRLKKYGKTYYLPYSPEGITFDPR
ncbi:pol polyprotein [Trichonephila clavipes]|nr:pol polyprotein [Trichonephila clavipes]